MAIQVDSYVQVAPDSNGKRMRNLSSVTVDATTGAESTVYTEVIALADAQGRLIDLTTVEALLQRQNDLLETMCDLFGEMARDMPTSRASISRQLLRR